MLRLQSVIILSPLFKKNNNKEKGVCWESALLISRSVFVFSFLSPSLFFFYPPPPLPLLTSFVQKCLLNKLTVLWRVISKARRHSMLMLNLFCIHLHGRGLSQPSRSYSLPGSSGLRAHTWSLLFVAGSILSLFPFPSVPAPFFFLFIKVVIIFQAAFTGMLGGAGV